ncbi:DUF3508 domain containing protein [Trypanosoma conorhini]|uniref:Cilia- and flagella-associated protein 206 n=1 Tax=Trypanosoma conorhini TaxID=83891 RepID=A0A422PVA4_9TRYP|nr:DUF3508 domain containing protein [Trypanosoma conorhini]RNF21437.1 DUF3508 domain containing protein [Trypanosoma conorhini]
MNVVPALAKEIVRRLRSRTDEATALSVTEELAAFVVRLSLFNSPDTDEKGNVAAAPEAIESMAEKISSYLAACSPHVLATLSLQCQTAALRGSFASKRRNEQVKQEAVTLRLLGSLCENSTRMPEEILSEIAFFILHRYRQLNATQGKVGPRKETAAVLNAVLPRSQVRAFANQTAEEKKRQLEELRRIVWGIRLYNKVEGRTAGIGLLALRETAEKSLNELGSRISEELHSAATVCSDYVKFLRSPSAPVGNPARQAICEEYHRQLQFLLNLRTAREQLDALSARIHTDFLPAYDKALAELQAVLGVGSMRSDGVTLRSRVPKRTVYPKFIALAEAYEEAEQSLDGFEEIQALLDVSLSLGKLQDTSLPPTILAETVTASKETTADRAAIAAAVATAAAPQGAQVLLQYAKDASELAQHSASRAMNGLCLVSLVEDGICVEGRTSEADDAFAGFVVCSPPDSARGDWYAFCSEYALRRFVGAPLRFIEGAQHLVQEDLVLAGLLDLLRQLPRELYIKGTRTYEPRGSLVAAAERHDACTQTGQRDPYMDHNYRWNEWDLRRQALKLVNLLDMRTHSTQTIASHFRRDNTTQVRPPRDDATQTMQDAAVQPPRTAQYLKGLRGTQTSAIETVQRAFLY